MNIVDRMIEYIETREGKVLGIMTCVATENLIIIVMELLSWLKLERKRELWIEQGRKTKLKPMQLNMSFPWCLDLVKLLQMNNSLSEIFHIEGNNLMFKSNIDQNYIHEARRKAEEKYNPEMIIN